MKAWKFLSAPLMLMLLACLQGNASATDQTVSAGFGEGQEQHITINEDVNVNNKTNAVFVEAHAPEEAEDKSASAKINGDVNFTNEDSASAVYVEGRNGDASAEISGNLSATSNLGINGIETWGHSYSGTGEASVTVDGNVTAESLSSNAEVDAKGIRSDCGSVNVTGDVVAKATSFAYGVESRDDKSITVGGNVNAEGNSSTGIYAYSSTQTNIDVKGGVSATGKTTTGIKTFATEGNESNVEINLTIGEGGINANSTATDDDTDGEATGIGFCNYSDGKFSADIKGDVVATSPNGHAYGIKTFHHVNETGNAFGKGPSNILIHGNLISDGAGICIDTVGEETMSNILVENTIDAKNVGVLLRKSDYLPYDDDTINSTQTADFDPTLNLTVWKIKPNDVGNVAENLDFVTTTELFGSDNSPFVRPMYTEATDFEKKIMYIIKVEQPGAGGTIKATDANGNDLAKSFDFDVAHEGDRVLLKANLQEGYKIVAAYNGLGEKQALLKDENGNYYIIVPKGGGVYLSVELEDNTEHHEAAPDDNKNTIEDDSKNNEEAENSESGSSAKSLYNNIVGGSSETLKTGDESQLLPWLLLSVVSMGGISGLEICNRKQQLEKGKTKK